MPLALNEVFLQPMTPGEYAAYERSMGATVVESEGIYWRRVRPGFYRPLLVFEPLNHLFVRPPCGVVWGGWQYAVCNPEWANGSISFLVFKSVAGYDLHCLEKKRRWEVRTAERVFTVRPLNGPEELSAAYPVYVDFQRRTGYKYRSDRLDPACFAQWARQVFQHPGVLVLGAWHEECLRAVSILQRVGRTLIYATFFATGEALRRHVASLMLHGVRVLGAHLDGVAQIYAGLRKGGGEKSVDEFYLQRGCEVVTLPARLHVHPVTGWLLKTFRPDLWRRLLGQPVEDPKPVAPAVAVKSDPGEVA
jgi:hypothetical protein